jgi:hypothetical protein
MKGRKVEGLVQEQEEEKRTKPVSEQVDQVKGEGIRPRDEEVQSKGEAGNGPVKLFRIVQVRVK